MQQRTWTFALFVILLLASTLIFVGCGGSNSSSPAAVSLSMSDPPTCGTASNGLYSHIYVTVTRVSASTNANAGDTDSSWVDLGPNLAKGPIQVDLLAPAASGCFLANFGTTNIPAGTYEQFRVILAPNNTNLANNACGSAGANCVVPVNSAPVPLQLSSESQTGIKIPASQIVGGAFTVSSSDQKNLNIDFDACASIVTQGTGQYRLKPVLHAGEVALTSNISGTLVDGNGAPITTGKAIVALEQKDAAGIDRVILQTTPDANGNFTLCPVANGSYDVVAVAITSANNVLSAYGPTLVANVSPGTALGNVKLALTPAGTGGSTAPASLMAAPLINNNSGVAVDYTVSALQSVALSGTTTLTPVTIPLAQQQSATSTLTTAANSDCVSGTWCVDGTLIVPAANITVGTFSSGTITYATLTSTAVNYVVEAQAFSTSTHLPTCGTPIMSSNPLTVTPGQNVTVSPALSFTACQ